MRDPEIVHTEPLPCGAVLEIRRDSYPTPPEHSPIGRVLVIQSGEWTRKRTTPTTIVASGTAGTRPEWEKPPFAVGSLIQSFNAACREFGAVEVRTNAGDFEIRAVATPADLVREGIDATKARDSLAGDVAPWRAYLEGDCYFYRVAYADGTEDACFGFYGEDEIPYMKDAGRAAFDADRAMAAAVRRCREILPTFEPVALGDLRAIRRAWDDGEGGNLAMAIFTLLEHLPADCDGDDGEPYRDPDAGPDEDGS